MNVDVRDAVATAIRTGPRRALDKVREVSGRAALVAIVVACVFTVGVSTLVKKGAVQITDEPVSKRPTDWRPPIKDCPDDVVLWDCIRHAMYREDI